MDPERGTSDLAWLRAIPEAPSPDYLLGTAGDKINAILAAAGHNLRLVLRRLANLFARIPGAVIHILAAIAGISAATTTLTA